MTHLYLVHPDAALRASLQQTLTNVWKDVLCSAFAPDQLPEKYDENALFLGKEKPDHLPDQAFFSLDLPQPVRLHILLRRIEARLQQRKNPPLLHIGDAVLDTRSREWRVQDRITDLTEKEIATILYLSHISRPVTREDLLRDVWEYAADTDTHTIETHIYRLRQKIEKDPARPEYLITEKDGYQLAAFSKA